MPRSRKRPSAGGNSTAVSGPGDRGGGGRDAYVAPGGGTPSDVSRLSRALNLPVDAVSAIMNCGGQGVRSSGRRGGDAPAAAAPAAAADPAMMNVWGDFVSEEADGAASAGAPAAAAAPPEDVARPDEPAASGPRSYVLPVRPRMRPAGDDAGDWEEGSAPTPGLLAQTGTLDASVPGRSSISKTPLPHELLAPAFLFSKSIFSGVKVALIAASPTSCHSVAIATSGAAYGWGRDETGQLGLGKASPVVPLPALLAVGGEDRLKFVGAAVGKYHTVLAGADGAAYASGGNLCGQLGINNAGARGIERFRRCVVAGQASAADGDGDGEGVKIVRVSCGENVSALLSSAGHLYTAGSSEFGQLGNGETGEHIVSAGKLGYANSAKFVRRSIFRQSEADAEGGTGARMTTGKGVDSAGRTKCVTLEDSGRIRLADVSCGKNHTVAVEAPSTAGGARAVPRVFSWGRGDYGCLGHGVQADEYSPRLVGGLRGPVFANNRPSSTVAGGSCSLVRTENGHVYYVGKHKVAGEATMRPTIVDALANNGHVVTCMGAGSQTVFCATKGGVTVSWGQGSHGELGYGAGENKSSSKPKFVMGLDSCLVSDVACGMGHTLFILRNEDEEDAKALKKVSGLEEADVAEFVEEMKNKKGGSEGADEPAKKKQKGKGKK